MLKERKTGLIFLNASQVRIVGWVVVVSSPVPHTLRTGGRRDKVLFCQNWPNPVGGGKGSPVRGHIGWGDW